MLQNRTKFIFGDSRPFVATAVRTRAAAEAALTTVLQSLLVLHNKTRKFVSRACARQTVRMRDRPRMPGRTVERERVPGCDHFDK